MRDLDVVVDELLFCAIVIADPIKEQQTTSTILVNMTLDSLPPRLEKLWKLNVVASSQYHLAVAGGCEAFGSR